MLNRLGSVILVFMMVSSGCQDEEVTPHALMASGLERAMPDDELGRRKGSSHGEGEESAWKLFNGWEGSVRLRTETVLDWTDGKERRVVEERTELAGDPLSGFMGSRQWSGTDFRQAKRTRETRVIFDGTGLWLSREQGMWSPVEDINPGSLGYVEKLGGAWTTYVGILGDGLRWTQVGATTRGGEVLARLRAAYGSRQLLSPMKSEPWWDDLMAGKRVAQVDGELLVELDTGKLREGMLSFGLFDPDRSSWSLTVMTRFDLEPSTQPNLQVSEELRSANKAYQLQRLYQKHRASP